MTGGDNSIMRITVPLDDDLLDSDLLREAQRLTGLTDLNDLIDAGLRALIARERARRSEKPNSPPIGENHNEAESHD